MNFYDKVHEMVRAFKDTPEFREYVELKNKLKEEKDAYDRLKDFKERQKNYQMEYIDGKEQSKEKLDEMQNLYSIVIQHETSRKLLENEMKINVMLADMQKIIFALEDAYTEHYN